MHAINLYYSYSQLPIHPLTNEQSTQQPKQQPYPSPSQHTCS